MRTEIIHDTTSVIASMIGMSHEKLSEMIYKEGMNYLKAILGDDAADIDMMSRSSHFWAWWKKQWLRTDRVFINEYHLESYKEIADDDMREWLFLEWRAAHHGISLLIHPNRFIMKQGFQLQYTRAALQREVASSSLSFGEGRGEAS